MDKTKITTETKEELEITRIGETPFNYAKTDKGNYIICGKVVLETNKTKEEAVEYLKEKPYELIALMCQAITIEMLNKKNK